MNLKGKKKPKWLIDFLCRWLGHDFEFIRGERRDGFFGEALCMEYECKRCHKTDAAITESFSMKCEVKP